MNIDFTNKLFDLKEFTQYSNTLIETGTCQGEGVQRALNAGFDKILSIEADENYFNHSLKRFDNDFKVSLWFGKSTDVLPDLLKHNKRTLVLFLDAHPSGIGSYGHDEWLKSGANIQDSIIKDELDIILASGNKHIIIIDDMQGLDSFSQVYIEKILKANTKYVFRFYDENLDGRYFYKNKILAATV